MSTIAPEKTPSTELIKVEEITTTMANASVVLAKNENLAKLCIDKGRSFLDTIDAEDMTDELDVALNDWQVKAKQALTLMNTRRSPITQMMSQIAKVFTSLENQIDPTKPESVYSKIQVKRNEFAKKKAIEQQAKEAAILKQQNVKKEAIEIEAKVESQIREAFQNKLHEFKLFYSNKLNQATLETLEAVKKTISDIKTVYPRDKFYELPVNVTTIYLDKAELAPIIFNKRDALYNELSASFRENMEDHQRSLLDQFPSKKIELAKIAKASADQKKQLEEQAQQRQLAEQKRLQEESDQAKLTAQQNIELSKNINTSNTLFDSATQLSEIKDGNSGQVRQGYKITVGSPAGWGAIFLFWFEKEGQKMAVDAIGKKSLDQMKTFCEKYAHKNNEKIDHIHVVYEDDYKAVAAAAK